MKGTEENQGVRPGGRRPEGRRALGNIANQQIAPNAGRNLIQPPQEKAGVLTRRAVAALAAPNPAPAPAAGQAKPQPHVAPRRCAKLPPAAAAPTAAVRVQPKPQAQRSMSQTLAARSEQAVAFRTRSKKAAAAAVRPVPASAVRASLLPDIDGADAEDPLHATDYVEDIYSYYRRVEPLLRVHPGYMAQQGDLNDKMRTILVDWLVDVHLKFKLLPESLYLTINLIDRFLEKKQVMRASLQLVGVGAMLIASKYEEIWAPQVRDFVYICDRAYSKEQILGMEKIMLSTLRFNLTVPTAFNFLTRFIKASGASRDKEVTHYATYLVELTLVDYGMLKFPASLIAASAVYAANVALGRLPAYPYALQRHSGYSVNALTDCAAALADLHRRAPNAMLSAVYKKYLDVSRCGVAGKPSPMTLLSAEALQQQFQPPLAGMALVPPPS